MCKIVNNPLKLPAPTRKQKVAVYCRVSTDRDAQLIPLDNQKSHYDRLTAAIGNWELTDYYDEKGISGTKKETRPELQRMLHDCETGKIDLILTKSISRFARNTTDCLELVRKLNALGISIYFEKEDLNTGDSESELILSILASLAEEESHSISSNCKWAVQKRFQNGSFKLSRPPYGYDLQNAYITMLNKLSYSRKDLLLPYINAVTTEDDHEIQQRLCRIRTKLQNIRMNRDDLVRRYSLGSIEASEFFEKTVACRREERELLRKKSITERFFGHTFSAQALDQFISEWKIGTSRFPQSSFCALTDHILISDRNQVTFVMKCGLRLSEEIGSVKKSGSGR